MGGYRCSRYFNQRFPGINPYQRATERFKNQLCRQHFHGVSQKALAQLFHVGKATVKQWYQHYYWLVKEIFAEAHCPRVLGIDEYRFGKRFATTFCDLRRNRVFDIKPTVST